MDKPTLTEQKIADLLGYLEEGIKQGADFTKEQAPLVAQEIIQWGIAEHAIYIVGLGVPLACLRWTMIRLSKKMKAESSFSEWQAVKTLGWIFGGLSIAVTVMNSLVIAKAILAPRLFLIEVIRGLL